MRHKCYQIDDFISPFFEEKEVTRLYDANLEPIYEFSAGKPTISIVG